MCGCEKKTVCVCLRLGSTEEENNKHPDKEGEFHAWQMGQLAPDRLEIFGLIPTTQFTSNEGLCVSVRYTQLSTVQTLRGRGV
ncbi:Protein of unknown function [Cotesia congregata]|uniref:Uncharacterized protein n=1 Tax=Cotesia congregata TaxID=51543 RepID=A0A8J2H791_COTCN|nr:Protein of unknown function [Cotesia congregata]